LRFILRVGRRLRAAVSHNNWIKFWGARHPSIVPYAQLSEAEKQKDRDTITLFLKDV